MFSYLRNIFRKKLPATAAETYMVHRAGSVGAATSMDGASAAAPLAVPRVETAQLQLAAIVAKFPDELRRLVLKMPPPEAMVALPLPTIQKFLPTGSVKMSLASVVRQAPAGTFAAVNTGDKRLVEVPLAEIFKRISPAVLKKRDQRFTELAADGFDIFGDDENPHALAPRFDEPLNATRPSPGLPTPAPASQSSRLQPPLGLGIVPPAGVAAAPKAIKSSPAPPPRVLPDPDEDIPRLHVVPNGFTPPPPAQPEAPVSDQPPLVVPVKDLAQGWPEPIRSEAIALNGTTVSIPSAYVSGGLAKGKVAFAWGQLRSWMNPIPAEPSQGDPSLELLLPLRVIAPAFLKHSRQVQQRKSLTMDDTIPELFGPGRAAPTPPEIPVEQPEAPAVAAAPESESVRSQEPIPQPPVEQPQAAETSPETEPIRDAAAGSGDAPITELSAVEAGETQTEVTPPQPESAPAPVMAVAAEPVATSSQPQTLGEAFGQPQRTNWSPSEIVDNLVKLPNVAGAAVALQEGLVIAHHLPEPMKGEVFAAFLPQIFARLNQYSGEMKLGAIEDILLHSSNGPCHVFRRGQVFFAALGNPGQLLPGQILRLCADALADQ